MKNYLSDQRKSLLMLRFYSRYAKDGVHRKYFLKQITDANKDSKYLVSQPAGFSIKQCYQPYVPRIPGFKKRYSEPPKNWVSVLAKERGLQVKDIKPDPLEDCHSPESDTESMDTNMDQNASGEEESG